MSRHDLALQTIFGQSAIIRRNPEMLYEVSQNQADLCHLEDHKMKVCCEHL